MNSMLDCSENEIITEKKFLQYVATTVVGILLCLASMAFTAYAYFSADLVSGVNTLIAARFETEVEIVAINASTTQSADTETTDPTQTPPPQTYSLVNGTVTLPEGSYQVTIRKSTAEDIASTGFCVITLSVDGSDTTYYTQQIGKNGETEQSKITFTLVLDQETVVHFLDHLGTSSHYVADQNGAQSEKYIKHEGRISQSVSSSGTETTDTDHQTTEDPTTATTTPTTETTSGTE